MVNFVLLALCFGLGVLARRFRLLPDEMPRVVSSWIIWFSLPALVLRTVQKVAFDSQMLLGAASLWLTFGVIAGLAILAVKKRWATAETAGAVALCAGLGNTVFVGFPLIEALAGKEALGPAAVVDQLGSFLALSLLAIPFATWMSGKQPSAKVLIIRVVKFPPFIALLLAFALRGTAMPELLDTILGRFADMLTPLALVSLGFQWDLSVFKRNSGPLAIGLVYKLLLAPLLVTGLLLISHHAISNVDKLSILQASMAPMITAGVLALEFNLNPRLAAAMIAVGVPLSFLTVPLWWHALGALFS